MKQPKKACLKIKLKTFIKMYFILAFHIFFPIARFFHIKKRLVSWAKKNKQTNKQHFEIFYERLITRVVN